MSILLSFLPSAAKLAFWLLEQFFMGKSQEQESRDVFLKLARLLRQAGVKNVKSRFDSESQIAAGNAEWDKRENTE